MIEDLFDVTNRIVIITGGLGQLGSEFVKEFLRRGARVAVFNRTIRQQVIQERFTQEERESSRLEFYAVDICKKSDLQQAVSKVIFGWGVPDVLVNNAGIDTQPSAPLRCLAPLKCSPRKFSEKLWK